MAARQDRLQTLSVCLLVIMGISPVAAVDTRYCYQCADTNSGGDCQTKLKTMAKAAYYILEPGISADDEAYQRKRDQYNVYVKNCTSYLQNPNVTYCVIESFEYRGQVNMYMRDCTDGVNFADSFEGPRKPQPDNQTYCDRKGDRGTYCVRMCEGHFCNGPRPSSGVEHNLSGILFIVCILTFIFSYKNQMQY